MSIAQAYYRPEVPLLADVKAVSHKSKLIHRGALEERVYNALISK